MPKMTKNEFCFRAGFNAAIMMIGDMPDHELEIAWKHYEAMPENATEAQMDATAQSAVDEITATLNPVAKA